MHLIIVSPPVLNAVADSPAVCPPVEDARWRDERVVQMEEAETLTAAVSPLRPERFCSDGSGPAQHPQQ